MALRKSFLAIRRSIEAAAPRLVLEAASLVADEVRRNAPVLTGRLVASVDVVPGDARPGVAGASVEVSGGHRPRDMVGAVEFGTSDRVANPFVRRSFGRSEGPAARAIASGVRRRLKT
jgi:Bacteriophage HK97-gp10, putative tail-component